MSNSAAATASADLAAPSAAPAAALRHPRGLWVLFFTEMWERFSYYGMRALFVLYLTKSVGYTRENALAIYGLYTGLVYLTPILGGYLADRYLGKRKAIFIGCLTMMLGHFAMAVPELLNLALGLLIIGNGFFKPNTTAMVGTLYEENSPKRDGGYTIFYMGINLGAFFSPLVCGTLGEKVGYHYGFASAGVGMAIGMITFAMGGRLLGDKGLLKGQTGVGAKDWLHIVLISAAMIPLVYAVIAIGSLLSGFWNQLPTLARGLLGFAMIAVPAYMAFRKEELTRLEWNSILVIFLVSLVVICFWMGFEQAGGTMSLFADNKTDRMVFGQEMPASWFQSINPLAIVLLAPILAAGWTALDRSRFALSDYGKQGLGMIVLAAGFVVMALADSRADAIGKVGPQWLAIAYVLHTIGELMVSPVGLSMVSKLAPVRLGSMMMGLWFLSTAIANYLAGVLESMLAGTGWPLYWFLTATSVAAGALLLLASPWLGRLTHGRH